MNRNQALSELTLESARITGKLNQVADRLARETGLSSARWQVLGTLANAGTPLTVAEIARRMELQRQSVQRTTNALARDGYVRFKPNPEHQRAKLVVLTREGARTLRHLQKLLESWTRPIIGQLSLDELHQAVRTLTKLRELIAGSNEAGT